MFDRVRKDTGTNFTEYYHFGGSVIAEQDQAGHWSDYIHAGGKRIAKADLYDTRLHANATTCNGCSGPYVVFNFTNIGDLNGHVIQAGEKMFVRQKTPSGMAAGVGFCFTNGNCLISYQVKDQDGQLAPWDNGTGSWHYRRIDLTPVAGLTINNAYMSVIPAANGAIWDVYYDDVAVQWADGTVHPLYTRESSLATFQYGTGQTNPTTVVETSTASGDVSNPAQTTYYYHGDQIGSSRLMTSGSGWPVWQGTFLPYGEEYNAQMGTNHYKFTGKERDDESELDYFGARYYSNGLGRWMSPDWSAAPAPVPYAETTDPQTLNLYGYVRGLPTTKVDLDGHGFWRKLWNSVGADGCWCEDDDLARHREAVEKQKKQEEAERRKRARELYLRIARAHPNVSPRTANILWHLGHPQDLTAIGAGFSVPEQAIADALIADGATVQAIDAVQGQKTADALVNGATTEFKTVTTAGTNTLKNQIQDGLKQAPNVVVDVRGTPITKADALLQIARAEGNLGASLQGKVTILTNEGPLKY